MVTFSLFMFAKVFFDLCFWKIFLLVQNFRHIFLSGLSRSRSMSFSYALSPVRNLLSSLSSFFYVKRAFLLFRVFSLSLVLSNLIDVSWCKFLHVCCSLNFSDLWVYRFHQIWKLFSHFFFKYIFLFSLFFSLSVSLTLLSALDTWVGLLALSGGSLMAC